MTIAGSDGSLDPDVGFEPDQPSDEEAVQVVAFVVVHEKLRNAPCETVIGPPDPLMEKLTVGAGELTVKPMVYHPDPTHAEL